ncbi:unnamed protein product [Durusdinium trenchii]|uniref:Uncharacterized protein n=1 Tax=Durusdinium trenchii TaxID=1381693 RepID=A0ABP0LEM3_9DINO
MCGPVNAVWEDENNSVDGLEFSWLSRVPGVPRVAQEPLVVSLLLVVRPAPSSFLFLVHPSFRHCSTGPSFILLRSRRMLAGCLNLECQKFDDKTRSDWMKLMEAHRQAGPQRLPG